MQLDRVPPPARPDDVSGTTPEAGGVLEAAAAKHSLILPGRRGKPLSIRGVLLILLGMISVLGQGERYRADPRLSSPSRAIASYWEALRRDDEQGALDCTAEGNFDVPYPGMLWFLPPTTDLTLTAFKSLPITSDRVMVSYIVRYRPVGMAIEQAFVTGCELVRRRGEWRIVAPIGEASMPEWQPTSRSVDS
ncbi:MAG TPA: hypothetical protein VL123_07995 [Candidatus Udaeobacter sp.]|nr:hypothetical protein [Candidatus Udaeobacter sp.]